jgi:hypothetical protein
MQAWVDAILNHACTEFSGRLLGHHPVEDQLHPVRPAQIQIVADNLFEELASAQRPVEDLRQTYFHLPDGQIPVVSGRAIFRPQWQRELLEPLAE